MLNYRNEYYNVIHENYTNEKDQKKIIWNEQFSQLSSLITSDSEGQFITVTSQPCDLRLQFVEEVLSTKSIPYLSVYGRSYVKLKDILLKLIMNIHPNKKFMAFYDSELMIELQSYYNSEKIHNYLVVEDFDQLPEDLQFSVSLLCTRIPGLNVIASCCLLKESYLGHYINISLPLLSLDSMIYLYSYQVEDTALVQFITLILKCLYIYIHNLYDLNSCLNQLYTYVYLPAEDKQNIQLLENPVYNYIYTHLYTNIYPLQISDWTQEKKEVETTSQQETNSSPFIMNGVDIYSYCGVEFSFHTKLLIITSYLCSIYDESNDSLFFTSESNKKRKGRKKQIKKPASMPTYSFTINRLINIYKAMLNITDPQGTISISSLHSQINMLVQAGIMTHSKGASLQESDMFNENNTYKCTVSDRDVLQLAANIQIDISSYLSS